MSRRASLLPLAVFLVLSASAAASLCRAAGSLFEQFAAPPDLARPGVYWYFMDGNQSREGMAADLKAMHEAGLRKALFLEVNIGVPRGPVGFMSEAWQNNFAYAVHTAEQLGMEIILGTGPGWSGAGGPWIDPGRSMKHLRASSVEVSGPARFTGLLPVPEPRAPSAFAGLSPELAKKRQEWYADVAVLAFPTPAKTEPPELLDVKALCETQPYSIWKQVPRYIPARASYPEPPAGATINPATVFDLTARLRADGSLDWEIPPGEWTVMRFAARSTGATTRPAPAPGHGFETDMFNPGGFVYQFQQFHQKLLDKIGPRRPGRGWTGLHLDSWEMSCQNWSANFRTEFRKRRGYDPQPFFLAYTGLIVGSREHTERFLWDLRRTSQELIIENYAKVIRRKAHEHGMYYSNEPYDMNPAGDIELGAVADIPMCEFWRDQVDTVYSCIEAVSIAHTMGRSVVRAESFTAPGGHGYQDNPADLKDQTDWAFAMGINDLIFHTYQHQPLGLAGPKPGMAMGPYGIQWHRNETFWSMVGPYHDYIARCAYLLRQGATVADVLYLVPEGAPNIFLPPDDAMAGTGLLRGRKGYNFDAVSPGILMRQAKADRGQIVFPEGTSYRLLVLPAAETMTPALLNKIEALVRKGVTVVGTPPVKSPSLSGYPQCDESVRLLAERMWGGREVPAQTTERRYGKGCIIWGGAATQAPGGEKLYPSYESSTALLRKRGVVPDFETLGPVRYHHRRTRDVDIFFVSNREARPVDVACAFRTDGAAPELWNPVKGTRRTLPRFDVQGDTVSLPLRFASHESHFIIFNRKTRGARSPRRAENFPGEQMVAELTGPYEVTFDPAWGGPKAPVRFDELRLWNTDAEEGIRYYSGQAVYRKSFDLPAGLSDDAQTVLDLGVVQKLTRVKLNGNDLGIVWTPPFRVDITGKLRPSGNRLEVTVANTWVNRLIGDQQPANKGVQELRWESGLLSGKPYPAGRYTFTTAGGDYTATSPLQDSGLLGPLRLVQITGTNRAERSEPSGVLQGRRP